MKSQFINKVFNKTRIEFKIRTLSDNGNILTGLLKVRFCLFYQIFLLNLDAFIVVN